MKGIPKDLPPGVYFEAFPIKSSVFGTIAWHGYIVYRPNTGDAGAKVISGWESDGFNKSRKNKLTYHIDKELTEAPDKYDQNAARSERVFQRIDPKVLGGAVGTDITDAELWRRLVESAKGMKSGFFYLPLDLKGRTTNSNATWATFTAQRRLPAFRKDLGGRIKGVEVCANAWKITGFQVFRHYLARVESR